ncbi:MAG: hypothetical protein O2960_17760 [Verrucomicrobia bacterium]|nr:hypothetical protein [Verrucomicrobiota bacterium]
MKAYKFKGAHQIPHAFDIIFNNRLYCADWSNLNDPMEGMFVTSRRADSGEDYKETVANIIREKKRLRVCSLSETFDCHLLWSHYASGFSGLAIEVELPDNSPAVKKVSYRGVFAGVSLDGRVNPQTAAEEILSSKYSEWQYEREIRVLHHEAYFPLAAPVLRVIVGHRMEAALFGSLNFMCHKKGIVFNRTGIGDEGIDADHVEPPKEDASVVVPATQPRKTIKPSDRKR